MFHKAKHNNSTGDAVYELPLIIFLERSEREYKQLFGIQNVNISESNSTSYSEVREIFQSKTY